MSIRHVQFEHRPRFGMLRQTLQLVVVVAGMAFAVVSHAQERDWKVTTDAQRDDKVVSRYRLLLLRNPDHTMVYRSLIAKLGRGPALDPFIAKIRAVAESSSEAEPWILLGHLEHDRGHDGASRAAYEHAVKTEPDNPATHAALGAALDRAGQTASADVEYDRALTLSAQPRDRRALLRTLADRAVARSDLARAASWVGELVEASPSDYALRVEYAETLLRAHRFDEALKTYQTALKLARGSGKRRAQMLVEIGNLHARMHNPVAAEQSYRSALTLVGRSSWMRREVLMRLVDTARDLGTLPTMLTELQREWPSPAYHDCMVLAGLAEELGRDVDAVRWLERAARLEPRAIEPRTRLIARFDHTRDAAKVQRLYDEIVGLRPRDIAQRLERIEWLFFRTPRADEAMAQLRALERERSGDPAALVEIAATWQRFGLTDAALRVHEELETSHPASVAHLEAYGELLLRLGRVDEGTAAWQRLFDVDPRDLGARLRVAEIAARLKDYDRAIALHRWVLDRAPRLTDARQRLAGLYETQQRWTEALVEWETLFFEDDIAHAGRRVVNIAGRTAFIGDRPVSPDEKLLARWEAHYADDPRLRTGAVLARLRAAIGEPAAAVELAEDLAAVDPGTLAPSEHYAWVDAAEFVVDQTQLTQPGIAIEMLARIASAFGDRRAPAWRRAVDLAISQPEPTEILDRALEAVPNDAYVHAVVGTYYSDSDVDRAIHHLQRAVALGTQSFEVYFDLASQLATAGREDEARGTYLDVMQLDASGAWATSAAFSAIDLSRSDAQLLEIEAVLPTLHGRLPASSFRAIAVAIYQELFVYGEDVTTNFAKIGERALPLLVDAVQADAAEDRLRASSLLQLYPARPVARAALGTWPPKPREWTETMILSVAASDDPAIHKALIEALDAESPAAVGAAIYAIGLARVSAGVEPLAARLGQNLSRTHMLLVAAALGRIGTPRAVERLEAYGLGQNDQRQLVVTWALGQGRTPEAAGALSKRLGSPLQGVRRLAGVMLSRFDGEDGLRSLLQAAWQADPVRRAMAEVGLRTAGLGDELWNLKPTTANLGEVPGAIARAVSSRADQPVARAFVGRESLVVKTARDSLREPNPMVLEHLLAVATEVDEQPTDELAPSLRLIVVGLRPRLRGLARSADIRTVASAAQLLPIAAHDEDAPLVAHAAATLPEPYGSRVVDKLARYPWPAVRPTLVEGLRSAEAPRRAAVLRVLARVAPSARDAEAVSLVTDLARSDDAEVQAAAIEALGALKVEASARMLAELYGGVDAETQRVIRDSLGKLTSAFAQKASRELAIRPTRPVCDGDPDDLGELLADSCVGAVEIPDF